jgi:2-keto-3-deoxy-L-rhamnonate aldolase RhmA
MSRSSVLTGYETMEIEEITAVGNSETMAIALVETQEGVRNAQAIASVEGLDAIMIGASDLCIDLGLPGKFEDPTVVSACADVIAACVSHSIPCGIAGVRSDALLRHFIGLGARMIHAGTDAPILVDAFKSRSKGLRRMWAELH